MKISRIEHLGIAVQSIDAVVPYFRDVLGLEVYKTEVVEDQKVKTAFMKVGEVKLELLEPTCPESTVQKYLDNGGRGILHRHHHHDGCCCEEECCCCHAEQEESKTYYIEGMHCSHCAANVEKAISSVEGVESCSVSLSEKSATVSGHADDAAVREAVESIGYAITNK